MSPSRRIEPSRATAPTTCSSSPATSALVASSTERARDRAWGWRPAVRGALVAAAVVSAAAASVIGRRR